MNTRLSVTVDSDLLDNVQRLLNVSTKAEAIRLALEHTARHAQLKRALAHAGKMELLIDQPKLEKLRSET